MSPEFICDARVHHMKIMLAAKSLTDTS